MKRSKKVWVVTAVYCDSGKQEDPMVLAASRRRITAAKAKNLLVDDLAKDERECAKEQLRESNIKVTEAAVNRISRTLARGEVDCFWTLEIHKTDLK